MLQEVWVSKAEERKLEFLAKGLLCFSVEYPWKIIPCFNSVV